jgi:predicted transcriptional regulator
LADETGSSVETTDRLDLTAIIAAAYVSNSTLPPAELPRLLADVHRALLACDRAGAVSQSDAKVEFKKPTRTQIRNSITPDGLISFIDGKAYAMLKRHLGKNGLDASGYRQRYGLPADYPMTSPKYSAQRSARSRASGLGKLIRHGEPGSETAE